MKSTLINPLFLASLLIFLCNQVLESRGIFLPVIHSYSDDLVCLPVILTPALAGFRYFLGSAYCFSVFKTVQAVFLISLSMEVVLPAFSSRHTADAADVLVYSIGGVLFHCFINLPTARIQNALPTKISSNHEF